MGILVCARCGITAEADNKEAALSKIDHAANSKKCDGKDELCKWTPTPNEGVKAAPKIAVKQTTSKRK